MSESKNPFDVCADPAHGDLPESTASRHGIYPSTAYVCSSPEMADAILDGSLPGYVYQRDGHPNADILRKKCEQLHDFSGNPEKVCGAITSSGMAALTLATLTYLGSGDHLLLANRLYGKTASLAAQLSRFGISSSTVDIHSSADLSEALQAKPRMLVVETISNPQLRVADLRRLSRMTRELEVMLLVDNTFATPVVCRPLELGADLVLESITKFMNGHGDLVLGMLCGRESIWNANEQRIDEMASTFGLVASPFDCWLAERGLTTLAVRMQHAAQTAYRIAEWLRKHPAIAKINYAGLPDHPDHSIAKSMFHSVDGQTCYSNLLSFDLRDDAWADRLIPEIAIPFCPSLGETSTTLSHPASTSHRSLNEQEMRALDISPGTIRLSIGLESAEYLIDCLKQALDLLAR